MTTHRERIEAWFELREVGRLLSHLFETYHTVGGTETEFYADVCALSLGKYANAVGMSGVAALEMLRERANGLVGEGTRLVVSHSSTWLSVTAWIERQFRRRERPQLLDVFSLWKKRDREMRLYHHDIDGEAVSAERAAFIATELLNDCQLHCNALKEETYYEISVVDRHNGGHANPIAIFLLNLSPKSSQLGKAK